jgi:hypothetical protein
VVVQRAKVEESGRREGRWDGTTSRKHTVLVVAKVERSRRLIVLITGHHPEVDTLARCQVAEPIGRHRVGANGAIQRGDFRRRVTELGRTHTRELDGRQVDGRRRRNNRGSRDHRTHYTCHMHDRTARTGDHESNNNTQGNRFALGGRDEHARTWEVSNAEREIELHMNKRNKSKRKQREPRELPLARLPLPSHCSPRPLPSFPTQFQNHHSPTATRTHAHPCTHQPCSATSGRARSLV